MGFQDLGPQIGVGTKYLGEKKKYRPFVMKMALPERSIWDEEQKQKWHCGEKTRSKRSDQNHC